MESATDREIRVDRNVCIGSAQCSWYAPNTFDQDEDVVAVVIDQHGDPEEQVQDAIRFCPTQSISLVEIPET